MKLYDKALSVNNEAISEPPATAHSGATPQYPGCMSDLYPELWADIMKEIANAITIAGGLTLDGTDRTQLSQAILANKTVPLAVAQSELNSGTDAVAWTTLSIPAIPTGKTHINLNGYIYASWDLAESIESWTLQIKDTNGNIYDFVQIRSDFSETGGGGDYTTNGNNSNYFDVSAGGTMEYRVIVSGGDGVDAVWSVDHWGWI